MTSSALFMAVCGIAAMFAPRELLSAADMSATTTLLNGVEICGALFLSFAVLNWMQRHSVIGGIYNRPLVVANTLHFFAGAMTLLRAFSIHEHPLFMGITLLYVLFAGGFIFALFRSPGAAPQS